MRFPLYARISTGMIKYPVVDSLYSQKSGSEVISLQLCPVSSHAKIRNKEISSELSVI
jgi:hypothetical protein